VHFKNNDINNENEETKHEITTTMTNNDDNEDPELKAWLEKHPGFDAATCNPELFGSHPYTKNIFKILTKYYQKTAGKI